MSSVDREVQPAAAVQAATDAARPREASGTGLLARARRTWRDQGPAGLWWKTLWDLGLHRQCHIAMGKRWHVDVPEKVPRIDVTGARLEPDRLDELLALRPDQSRGELEGRFARGHLCYGVWRAGQLISAAWTGIGRVELDYLRCAIDLAPNASYNYDEYTLPAYRRNFVSRAVGYQRMNDMLDRGYLWNMGIIWQHNLSAWERQKRAEHPPAGVIGFTRIGPRPRWFLRWTSDRVDPANPPLRLVPGTDL